MKFNAIHLPSALKIEMFRRRQQHLVVGERAWLATAEDVVLHKLYWYRITPSERQLGDVTGVITVQANRLDKDYLRHWAAELGVSDLLENALAGSPPPKQT